jgi:hypothetical protein
MRTTISRIQVKASVLGMQVIGNSKNGYYLQPLSQDWSSVHPSVRQQYKKQKIKTLQGVDECLNLLHEMMQQWKHFYQKVKHLYSDYSKLSDAQQIGGFLETVSFAISQIQLEEQLAQQSQQAYQANRQAWITQQGLLTQEEITEQWNLIHKNQFFTAISLEWLHSVEIWQFPSNCYPPSVKNETQGSGYYRVNRDVPLTENDHQQLMRATLLTRLQGAEFLKVTPQKFDKFKKQYGLSVAEQRYALSHGKPPRQYYLYRLADLLELQQQIAHCIH